MKDKYNITIEPEDFIGAKRGTCRDCLVARAVKRVTGFNASICDDVRLYNGGRPLKIARPDPAETYVRYSFKLGTRVVDQFDDGHTDRSLLGKKIVIVKDKEQPYA